MNLTRLEIQNFMGITASEIVIDGAPMVTFEGACGSGKTSHLRAIQALFCGGKAIPDVPIKRGAKKAQIIGETETLICTRTFTPKGTKLEIRPNEAGAVKLLKPQQVLDELIGMFLDPLEFDLMKPEKRASVLRKIAGLDLSGLDEQREKLVESRRDVGRDRDKAQGALAKMPAVVVDEDPPSMTAKEIMAEIKARQQRNDDRNSKRNLLKTLLDSFEELVDKQESEAAAIKEAKASLAAAEEAFAERAVDIESKRSEGKTLAALVEGLTPDEQITDLEAQLDDSEAAATRAAQAARRAELELELKGYLSQYDQYTDELGAIAEERASAIAGATYPVKGLAAQDGDAWLDGLPWRQANSARRIEASTAMAFALHKDLKIVCVEQASLLDPKAREIILDTAVKCGGQAFLEIVGSGDEVSVVIESQDGES